MESEFYKMLPTGVSLHTTRMECHPGITIDELRLLSYDEAIQIVFPNAENAAKLVSAVNANVNIYGTTDMSHLMGEKWNTDLTNRLEKVTQVKTITASTAVIEGLNEMDINKLVLVTPYTMETTKTEKKWLESMDFDVVDIGIHYLEDQLSNIHRGNVHPELLYNTVKEKCKSNFDGVFISCTNLRTIEIIDKLEEDLGKPVVSSNLACMWAALRAIGIKNQVSKFGSLLNKI